MTRDQTALLLRAVARQHFDQAVVEIGLEPAGLHNLRGTLLVPSLLGFLVAAWGWFPGAAILWTLVALLVATALFALLLIDHYFKHG